MEHATRKLYHEDMYMKEFEAVIISAEENIVVLDATAFAPDAGGQPCDQGTLNGIPVTAVHEKNGVIFHELLHGDAGLQPGVTVCGALDWERRFDHMQNHLGEHILSAVFKSEYGLDNKGFHLGEESATFDIDSKEITQEMLDNVELKANEVVYRALPVQVSMIASAEEALRLPLRKELKADEDITVVTIPGVDCVACCCPQPSDTSQIGVIKIIRTEKYKGMTRIHYKCGRRALMDYRRKHSLIMALDKKYSADEFTLLDKIKAADAKNDETRHEMNRLKDALANIRAAEFIKKADKMVEGELENANIDDLRQISKKLVNMTDLPVVLSSLSDMCVFMTHNGKSSMKCGALVREYAAGAGGKGGGGDTQAQVFFKNAVTMHNFIDIVRAGLQD